MIRAFYCVVCLMFLAVPVTFAQGSTQYVATRQVQDVNLPIDFRLSPGDAIEVKFFYNPELDTRVQIRPDGHISMALAGEIDLSNRTVDEATRQMEVAYRKVLRTPAITIQAVTYAAQKVYVGGEVLRPGVVALPGRMTVLEAIMEAGGLKNTGRSSSVVLIRRGENGDPVSRTVSFKMKHERASEASQMLVRPYDVILVPESRIASADRWVDQHVRQLLPINMSAGFSYLANSGVLLP